jgi:phage gp36-like protein
MAYCTRADIEALVSAETLRQLTDDEQAGDVDDSIVDACIASADASIDGYLRGRYTVPLATVPVPQLVLDISRDIAVYNLFSRKGEGGVPEIFSSRKNDARKQLKDIAEGILVLGVATPDAQLGVSIAVDKTDDDRVFSPTVLQGF